MKQIKGLDTLRAFAVCCVIIQHWGPQFTKTYPVGRFIQTFFIPGGATGVYIFFTLSGFLITSILLNARINNNGINRISIIKNFFARRVLRIFPIYYLMVLILLCVYPDNIKDSIGYLLTYTLNFTAYSKNAFISFFSHSWTLDIEEQFYLFWPWLILFINNKYLKYVFIGGIIMGIISSYISLDIKQRIEPFYMTDCIDAFSIGGLYAYARLEEEWSKKFEKIIRYLSPLFLLLYFYWKLADYFGQPEYDMFLEKTVDSFITIWLIILIVNNKSEITKKYVLENRFFNFIGKISYGIYIYHPYIKNINEPLKSFLNETFLHNAGWRNTWPQYLFLYITDLTLLFFVCWLSYILIETPALKLKKLFKYNS